jgi:hypothetical protein
MSITVAQSAIDATYSFRRSEEVAFGSAVDRVGAESTVRLETKSGILIVGTMG